jgi:hypothetical protein
MWLKRSEQSGTFRAKDIALVSMFKIIENDFVFFQFQSAADAHHIYFPTLRDIMLLSGSKFAHSPFLLSPRHKQIPWLWASDNIKQAQETTTTNLLCSETAAHILVPDKAAASCIASKPVEPSSWSDGMPSSFKQSYAICCSRQAVGIQQCQG